MKIHKFHFAILLSLITTILHSMEKPVPRAQPAKILALNFIKTIIGIDPFTEMTLYGPRFVATRGGVFDYTVRLFNLSEMKFDFRRKFTNKMGMDAKKISNIKEDRAIIKHLKKYIEDLNKAISQPIYEGKDKIAEFQSKYWTFSLTLWLENPYEQIVDEIGKRKTQYSKLSQEEIWEDIIYHSFNIKVDTYVLDYGYLKQVTDKKGEMQYHVYIPGSIEIHLQDPKTQKYRTITLEENDGLFEYIFTIRNNKLYLFHRFFKRFPEKMTPSELTLAVLDRLAKIETLSMDVKLLGEKLNQILTKKEKELFEKYRLDLNKQRKELAQEKEKIESVLEQYAFDEKDVEDLQRMKQIIEKSERGEEIDVNELIEIKDRFVKRQTEKLKKII